MSEQINVDQAFNPELRQAQADFDAYLETRPYQGDDGKIYAPDGERIKKKAVDAYFDQARDSHYEESQDTPYEELTMSELADELAYAELTEDETKIGDLSDALLDKMEEFSGSQVTERNPDGMDGDAQMNLFDRVMRLKDQKKQRYLETNGHEISDRVRNEFFGTSDDTAKSIGVETAGDTVENGIDQKKKEFVAKFNEAVKQNAEGNPDADRLLDEARELGNEVYKAQIADLLERAGAAAAEGDLEEAGNLDMQAHRALLDYFRLNGIDEDSEEAQRLVNRLSEAVDGGDQDVFREEPVVSAEGDEIPTGAFDEEGDEMPELEDDETADPQPQQSRWDRIRNVLGFGREDEERQNRGVSRMRRFMGGAALVGAGLVAGFLIGNSNNTTEAVPAPSTTTTEAPAPTDTLPESIQEELDQHKALEEAGVTDEATRVNIIHNPEAFKRMAEDPESFVAMVKWHENRVNELMQNDPTLSNDDARSMAEKQFKDYIEDLDDEDAS